VPPTRARPSRTPEEAVGYAVAHRIRVEVLSALNERSYSTAELARVVHQPLSTVTHHIEELLKANCIEVAFTKKVRAIDQSFYRAISMPFVTEEEVARWPFEKRQVVYSLILQNATAEAMASLWAGKISDDLESWMTWCWINVDAQGRRDIMEEQERSFERVQEIEAESNARRVESGEESRSIVVTSFGFERSRNVSRPAPGELET
jgi:DNA-binding transcriptional ArsR family regulator